MDKSIDDHELIFRWADYIKPILKNPDVHIRDKAIIAVAWESHPEPLELHQLSFGDLEDKGDKIAIQYPGPYGGERIVEISGAMPYSKKWIREEHPVTERVAGDANPLEEAPPETSLWVQLNSNESIPYQEFTAVPERASKCTDVPAQFTFSDLLLSRAILIALKLGQSNSAFQERFGCGLDGLTKLRRIVDGDGLREGVRPHLPIQCPECGELTPQYQACLWCGTSANDLVSDPDWLPDFDWSPLTIDKS